jgi:signal transduction histidine kinase
MSTRPSIAAGGPPARILVVDDEPHNRELLEVLLTQEGHRVTTAKSGEEALVMIAAEPPDLVLLDVMMSGKDGYQVTAEIKGHLATKDIPVIVVSVLDNRRARMLALNAGAEDFLSKPVDRAELVVRVRNLLRLKAAIEEARVARMLADHANNAKTLFLQSMSHELRTPLSAITGFAELLESGVRGPVNEEQTKDLVRIQQASAYLLRLINDLLSVARLEGERPVNLTRMAVNPALAVAEGLCANRAIEKRLTLTVVPSESETVVTADPERFQQILLNLITNAIKFTKEGGSITVRCQRVGETANLTVHDTGVGIRAADLDRVFEAFVQLDRHLTTEGQQGVGLGLSISRELSRAMHGDLTLRSTAGVGSTFTLTLPLAPEASVVAPTASALARV